MSRVNLSLDIISYKNNDEKFMIYFLNINYGVFYEPTSFETSNSTCTVVHGKQKKDKSI